MSNLAENIKETDIAWLAGLLEGEGSFLVSKNGHSPSSPSRIARITVGMLDKDIIQKAANLLGSKMSFDIIVRGGVSKPFYRTGTARKDNLRKLLPRLMPYMGKRRLEQIMKMIKHMEGVS